MTALDALSPDLFEDRKVLVTGAGRGIGRAVAAAFATLGAHVLAHLGTTERGGAADVFPELSDGARGRISMMTADLATIAGAEAVIAAIVAELGGLDILVNNAGTMHGRVMASDMTAEHYARVVDLNARSVALITSGAIQHLARSDAAAIVNTSSISATTGGSPGSSLYSAAKAFVSTYTRSMARELAPLGIRVNAVSPGTIMTDFHRRYSTPEKLEGAVKTIPLGRLGAPEDCVGPTLFLACGALSGYVTGQVLEINGGQLMG